MRIVSLSERAWVLAAALTVAIAMFFGRSCWFGFCNYDDPEYVTENEHVQSGLTSDSVHWALTSTEHANWFPLIWLSLELDYELWGLNPRGFHLINLLLHEVNTLLLFWFLCRTTSQVALSGVVAALFAIHPLHVESVVWITERKDVLSTVFWMLTLVAYSWYATRPCVRRYAVVLLLFALGLTAKPMLVTLPCVMLLLDYWPLERLERLASPPSNPARRQEGALLFRPASPGWLVLEKLPFLALSMAVSVMTILAQAKGGAVVSASQLPLLYRLMNVPVAYVGYLAKTIMPAQLAVFYPHPGPGHLLWLTIASTIFLGGVTWLAVRERRTMPWLLVGWLWYLGTLVPVIGLVQVGRQGIADRYTYVPLVGIFIAAVWGVRSLVTAGRLSPKLAGTFCGVALSVFAACTWVQVGYWRDNVTLWQRALQVGGPNTQVLDGLGEALMKSGHPRESLPYLRELTRQWPDYYTGHMNLAVVLLELGHNAEGEAELKEGLRLNPQSAAGQYNAGRFYYLRGDLKEATVHLREAVRLQPRNQAAQSLLAEIAAREAAIPQAPRPVAADPGMP